MDGGSIDCVLHTARDHVAKFHAAPAGNPGADGYTLVVNLSVVLVCKRVSLELF
jgi:hypothetical protein